METPHEQDQDPAAVRLEEPQHKRLDRHWNELLQELRVTQSGVQILAGLLFTLPFQSRFEILGREQTVLYLVAVTAATLSAALLIAPVAFHRALFRRRMREELIQVSATVTKLGLALLGVSLTMALTLVFSTVAGWLIAGVAAAVAVVFFVSVWLALPLWWGRNRPEAQE